MTNITPITQFIQLLKSAEFNNQKEIKMTIINARLLHIALNELMLELHQNHDKLIQKLLTHQENQIVTVNIDGGSF